MKYRPGDYVSPADLPRRFVCHVLEVESMDGGAQILKLEPLEGPWSRGTFLIRFDSAVVPVDGHELRQRAWKGELEGARRRIVTCSRTGTTAIVQVEARRSLRVAGCSRWPQLEGCEGSCIAPVA